MFLDPNTPESIRRLPDHLINLIAAGEVVERPASIVKELIENSIDAGARRIDVGLGEGGITQIEILDDGFAMGPRDLKLCFERHATSKLAGEADLEAIATFGFRGEAVSSIASVARVTIKTRQRVSDKGYSLTAHFGELQGEPSVVGMAPGTVVTVCDLFERIPARLKYLRTPSTEFAHCIRTVKEIALGNPEVQFFLKNEGGSVKSFIAPDRLSRVKECLRPSFEPLVIEESTDSLSLQAFLSPAHHISDRGELIVIVNGRSIKNRNLLSAARTAYRDVLGQHHDPTGVIYLDIRKDWVDVNVHPQKTEVRIQKSESLYSWIVSALRKALSRPPQTITEAAWPTFPEKNPAPVETALSDFSLPIETAINYSRVAEAPAPYEVQPLAVNDFRLRYLGQIKAAYLVCEDDKGLLLIDQHALHEKFRFEELMAEIKDQTLPSQRLLEPKVVTLSLELTAVAQSALPVLGALGLEIEILRGSDVAIRTIPLSLNESEAESVLVESLQLFLDEAGPVNTEKLLRPYLATVACHSVVRANQKLSDSEALRLLGYLSKIEMGWTCPHGRPVLFRMGFAEMERYFERR